MRRLRRSPLLPLALPVAAGLALGLFAPSLAVQMKPLSEAFIHLLGWLTYPLVFCMLAASAAALGRDRELGRTGVYALLYFAAMSVLAMLAGLAAGWAIEPGAGAALTAGAGPAMAAQGVPPHAGMLDWLDCLPPLRTNNLLLLAAALPAGLLLGRLSHAGAPDLVGRCRLHLLDVIKAVLRLAPLAAFGAMAATVALLHVVPPEMVAILFAVDRTMKCRLLTNVIGHGVACVVLAAWEGTLDRGALENTVLAEPGRVSCLRSAPHP